MWEQMLKVRSVVKNALSADKNRQGVFVKFIKPALPDIFQAMHSAVRNMQWSEDVP